MILQSSFPRLFPTQLLESPTSFQGFISISGKDYFINLNTPFYPYSKNLVLQTDIQLLELLHHSKFADNEERKYVVENCGDSRADADTDQHAHLSLLLSDIEDLGWNKVSTIAADFLAIDLECRDSKDRSHVLHVKIPSKYPSQLPLVEGNLPIEVKFKNKTLLAIYKSWERHLLSLQTFWNVLDELDETAFIIDPVKPSRKHSTRRIMLDNQVSIHLTVSIDQPCGPPKCHLLGPSSLVTPMNDKLVELYQVWDDAESIVYNLEHILKARVVKKSSMNSVEDESVLDDYSVECAVCYCLHLEDQLPDFTCDHCKKSFHLQCLYDWLCSLPSSRQMTQFIRGDCPYCTKAITCKVPS